MTTPDQEVDAILLAELGKLGAIAGGMSGNVGGAIGASSGAAFVAKRLPTEGYQEAIHINTQDRGLVARLRQYFDGQHPASTEGGLTSFKKVVGSGFLNMNPTYLVAVVGNGVIHFAAYAKEGLIKQHSAAKAVHAAIQHIRS